MVNSRYRTECVALYALVLALLSDGPHESELVSDICDTSACVRAAKLRGKTDGKPPRFEWQTIQR